MIVAGEVQAAVDEEEGEPFLEGDAIGLRFARRLTDVENDFACVLLKWKGEHIRRVGLLAILGIQAACKTITAEDE
jgi:hypothetical protein